MERKVNQPNINHTITPITTNNATSMKAGVISHMDGEYFIIEGSLPAKQALSCLVKPRVGDQVMYWNNVDDRWILAVLTCTNNITEQDNVDAREVSLPGNAGMQLQAKKFTVNAQDDIHLNSLGNIALNTVVGKLSFNAKSCIQTIQDSFINIAKHMINRADYIDQQAEKVLKSHASHQIITAEKDVKVDAERINMG